MVMQGVWLRSRWILSGLNHFFSVNLHPTISAGLGWGGFVLPILFLFLFLGYMEMLTQGLLLTVLRGPSEVLEWNSG